MSSSAARRVAQLNAHLTDAPVDQIQRFPTAAVRSDATNPRARRGAPPPAPPSVGAASARGIPRSRLPRAPTALERTLTPNP